MRKRTSIIWSIPDDEFITRVKNSKTMSELLRTFGLQNKGNNFITCKQRMKALNVDHSHFLNREKSSILTRTMTEAKFRDIIDNKLYISRNQVKIYVLRFNLVPYICDECGILPEWNNKSLTLQLEHKNGISDDNTISNLSFLCPNCHSQTETYAGKRHKKTLPRCEKCDNVICKNNKRGKCIACDGERRRKAVRPSKEELILLLTTKSMECVAKNFGLKTGNTIKKWCKDYNIDSKNISPFSRQNKAINKKIKTVYIPKSKYKYVSYDSKRDEWIFSLKKDKKGIVYLRFSSEIDAANKVKEHFNLPDYLYR